MGSPTMMSLGSSRLPSKVTHVGVGPEVERQFRGEVRGGVVVLQAAQRLALGYRDADCRAGRFPGRLGLFDLPDGGVVGVAADPDPGQSVPDHGSGLPGELVAQGEGEETPLAVVAVQDASPPSVCVLLVFQVVPKAWKAVRARSGVMPWPSSLTTTSVIAFMLERRSSTWTSVALASRAFHTSSATAVIWGFFLNWRILRSPTESSNSVSGGPLCAGSSTLTTPTPTPVRAVPSAL